MNRIAEYVFAAKKFKNLDEFEKTQIRLFWVNIYLMSINLCYTIFTVINIFFSG